MLLVWDADVVILDDSAPSPGSLELKSLTGGGYLLFPIRLRVNVPT